MANTVTGFFQTLVAAGSEASQALVGTTAAMDSCYLDYKPVETNPGVGRTLSINIPVSPTITDAGVAALTPTDISFTNKTVVFDKHPSFCYKIEDFNAYNSPSDIRGEFLDATLKAFLENINNTVVGKYDSTNFNVNSVISCTGQMPTTTQFLSSFAALAGQKVPMNDTANLFFHNHEDVYAKMLDNSNWTQASIAGEAVASRVRSTGDIKVAYGTQIDYDQAMTRTGSATAYTYTGIHLHRNAIALVTRPLPKPDPNVVEYTYVNLKGIPVRIMFGYSQKDLAWVVTVDAGYGVSVIRPELGVIFSIAQ
jgi:hypothetical protein